MFTTSPAKTATALGFAAWFSSAPFGVSLEDIAIGTLFAAIGVIGRGMLEMQKTLERGDKVQLARSLAWIGCGIFGAPFVTILYLAFLQSIHWSVDAFAVMALSLLGFSGPKSVAQLVDFISGALHARGVPAAPAPQPPEGG
jgi:hypothetical protein